jgi:hypothetical protein
MLKRPEEIQDVSFSVLVLLFFLSVVFFRGFNSFPLPGSFFRGARPRVTPGTGLTRRMGRKGLSDGSCFLSVRLFQF